MVTRLPAEILTEIFWLVAFARPRSMVMDPLSELDCSYGPVLFMMLVCRRWHMLAERILYHRVRFGHSSPYDPERDWDLLRLLESQPHLTNLVREVVIYQRAMTEQLVPKILKCCNRTQSLVYYGPLTDTPSGVLEAIKSLPLRRLYLKSITFDLLRDHKFLFLFEINTLEELYVIDDWTPENCYRPFAQSAFDNLPKNYIKSSNIKVLHIGPATLSLGITTYLVSLPIQLEELSLGDRELHGEDRERGLEPDYLERLLALQHDSLKKIRFPSLGGSYVDPIASLPSFANLPQLEELWIHSSDFFGRETPDSLYQKVSAPKLKLLVVKFTYDTFTNTEVQWLEKFVSIHSQSRLASNLSDIYFDFEPSMAPVHDIRWPWDRLKKVTEFCASHGIRLTSTETIDRAKWDLMVVKNQKRRETLARIIKERQEGVEMTREQREIIERATERIENATRAGMEIIMQRHRKGRGSGEVVE